jgi:xanthine dehydrogenase accessory factor
MVLVGIKGAGDLASGVALRLRRTGFRVVMSDLGAQRCVRRTVSFCTVLTDASGLTVVEGQEALLAETLDQVPAILSIGKIPVTLDHVDAPSGLLSLGLDVLVDGVMAKRNTGTTREDAPLVIALGPGFVAGKDCHAVVETARGHTLGRLILPGDTLCNPRRPGAALDNTGIPGDVGGYGVERIVRATSGGTFVPRAKIGDMVEADQIVGYAGNTAVLAQIRGVLRGLLAAGTMVHRGMKCGDVDPRAERSHCFSVSDKALAVAGGVLEGILRLGCSAASLPCSVPC